MRLSPQVLIAAYAQGIFPMTHDDGRLYWYDPDPRAIIPLDTFYVPTRLARTIRSGKFSIKVDSAFRAVMEGCAAPAQGREHTWISKEMIEVYSQLNSLGMAHSVETWQGDQLVGGLYGVALGGLFAGESMFSRVTDASKVALAHLVERLRAGGYLLLDTQFKTDHLARFGVLEISRVEYQKRLGEALSVEASFFPAGFSRA